MGTTKGTRCLMLTLQLMLFATVFASQADPGPVVQVFIGRWGKVGTMQPYEKDESILYRFEFDPIANTVRRFGHKEEDLKATLEQVCYVKWETTNKLRVSGRNS